MKRAPAALCRPFWHSPLAAFHLICRPFWLCPLAAFHLICRPFWLCPLATFHLICRPFCLCPLAAFHLICRRFWLCPLAAFHLICCATAQMGPGQSLMHLASDAVRAAAESPFLEEAVKKASAILCCISMPSPKQRFAGTLPVYYAACICMLRSDWACLVHTVQHLCHKAVCNSPECPVSHTRKVVM